MVVAVVTVVVDFIVAVAAAAVMIVRGRGVVILMNQVTVLVEFVALVVLIIWSAHLTLMALLAFSKGTPFSPPPPPLPLPHWLLPHNAHIYTPEPGTLLQNSEHSLAKSRLA